MRKTLISFISGIALLSVISFPSISVAAQSSEERLIGLYENLIEVLSDQLVALRTQALVVDSPYSWGEDIDYAGNPVDKINDIEATLFTNGTVVIYDTTYIRGVFVTGEFRRKEIVELVKKDLGSSFTAKELDDALVLKTQSRALISSDVPGSL